MSSSRFSAAASAATSTAFSALFLNVAVTPLSSAALAADDGRGSELEEVVVTAERRVSDAQKTAASLTVRTGEDLLKNGKFSLQQILEDVPGVGETFTTTRPLGSDQAGNSVVIRGVQSNYPTGGLYLSAASATAAYVDDIYEGIGGSYDLARVEVLRGPQGTLYGRSATSGVVAIHTRDPELGRWGGNASVEAGSYSLQHYTAALNVPIGDAWALRVAGNQYQRDGYYSREGGALETTEGRAKLLFNPSDDFSAQVAVAAQDSEAHLGGVSAVLTSPDGNDYTYNTVPIGGGTSKFRQYWAKIDWNIGIGTLTYLPSMRTWEQNSLNVIQAGGFLYRVPIETPYDHFHMHELRLTSKPGSRLTWQTGASYYQNTLRNSNTVVNATVGAINSTQQIERDTKDIGLFGEATYPFSDSWRITAGVRYDITDVQVTQAYTANTNPSLLPEQFRTIYISGEQGRRTYYDLTYKFRVEHDLTSTSLLYAGVASGFTPGDVQAGIGKNLQPTVMEFEDQILTSYEIGTKNRFFDNSLQLNAGVFYYRYGGYQTAGINVSGTRAPGFTTLVIPARMKGVELETQYQLTAFDRVSLNYSYTSAWYLDMPQDFTTYVGTDRPWGVPTRTGNVSYDRLLHLPGDSRVNVRAAVRYIGPYDANRLAVTPARMAAGAGPWIHTSTEWVGDLTATWTSADDRYSIGGYVRNVTDNRYKTNVDIQGDNFSSTTTAVPYDPRTYGVVFTANF